MQHADRALGNFKWRVESESKSLEQRALSKAASPLLSLLDDLNRAERAAKWPPQEVQKVLGPLRRRLLGVLDSDFQVRPMRNAVGMDFDPKLHEAIGLREGEAARESSLKSISRLTFF